MELKKCLNSFHIDYFVYKSGLSHFASLFEIMTSPLERLTECLNDRRMSRAYEACLILIGDKIDMGIKVEQSAIVEDDLKKLKKSLTTLAQYLCENFQAILETEDGIFALRALLRLIGATDVFENVNQTKAFNKKLLLYRTRAFQLLFRIENVLAELS